MNSNFLEDLKDYYDSELNAPWDEYQLIREELRTAALNKFDHLIVKGPLSTHLKQNFLFHTVTVKETEGRTIFSGWAKTDKKGKTIDSPFSKEFVEEKNEWYKKALARQEAEEKREAEEFEKHMESQD